MKIKIVDGSSLAAATVLNKIPKGTIQVLLRGKFNKVAFLIANALCKKNVQIWLVGDEWDDGEQMEATEGSLFIPFSHFPPKQMREDCFYHYTPAMITPTTFKNSHSCENWLPRRVMSAWRIAGIIHALEGWNLHECGDTIISTDKVWEASIIHGFQPLKILTIKHD
ncbi:hypothetical protein TSUD_330190 [Trifolium subterraneum]|nr:hypothetical protein TSUD_330190 [Trifolium subterraneum]